MPMIVECGQRHFAASFRDCRYPGWMTEMFDYLMHRLNWTYEIVAVTFVSATRTNNQ